MRRIAYLLPIAMLAWACGTDKVTVPEMVDIPAGSFIMGSDGEGYNYDEAPAHEVSLSAFRMSACEITNAQFEEFCPEHKKLRGSEFGLSTGDNEAACYLTWYQANEYCKWLSEKTGRQFRLPTEAEWEYACRAGSTSLYCYGDTLDASCLRNQQTERNLKIVSMEVGKSKPNVWGLYDMHGNVEEWCYDWYAAYTAAPATNPAGPNAGLFAVTRGGSHNTPLEFLRSANRSATFPDDSHSQIGFRIVEAGDVDCYEAESALPRVYEGYATWPEPLKKPIFEEPIPYVIPPVDGSPFYNHNHQPAITWCNNGDLLAIWFSCDAESGREMVVLGSRFRDGKWSPATLFFKVPDRNMTGCSLIRLDNGEILHINGMGNSGDWQNLAMVIRRSEDNGKHWDMCFQATGHGRRHQVIAGGIVLRDGTLVQPCDAGAEGNDGTAVQISRNEGEIWADPWDGEPLPMIPGTVQIADGTVSSTIGGIHAGLVELEDGSWMAMGRGNPVPGPDGKLYMPKSVSGDFGKNWTITASCFPPIDSGQRLILRRLDEGPLLLVSFGQDGVFTSLSYDDGKNWSAPKLLTDGKRRVLEGGAWTGSFVMDGRHSEPKGYFAATQTPDGIIHILSSRLHYRINLAWLEK